MIPNSQTHMHESFRFFTAQQSSLSLSQKYKYAKDSTALIHHL